MGLLTRRRTCGLPIVTLLTPAIRRILTQLQDRSALSTPPIGMACDGRNARFLRGLLHGLNAAVAIGHAIHGDLPLNRF